MNRSTRTLSLVLLLGGSAVPACGDGVGLEGKSVGGPCTTADDCAGESRCLSSPDFPGGTCARNCSASSECPSASACVQPQGGACLLRCQVPADCRGGYTCRAAFNLEGSGQTLVCLSEGVGPTGTVIGGPCTAATDCASGSRCLLSGDFPGGTCATNCASHVDCPSGARCINKEDGSCLLGCEVPADCRGGYTCKGKANQSGGGESLVCTKD